MSKIAKNIKSNVIEILFSPFLTLVSMASSGEDISDGIELDPNSTDQIVAYLANNQEEVDEKVNNYGGKGKTNRQRGLKELTVNIEDLKKEGQVEVVQQEKGRTISYDNEREK